MTDGAAERAELVPAPSRRLLSPFARCLTLRIMTTNDKKKLHTRESILALLSDAEVAKVSSDEAKSGPVEGDEYIDLEHPNSGVHQAHAKSPVARGAYLSRSAVSDATWQAIVRAVAG